MKFAQKFQKFMYGRYGIDDLYKFLFKVYIFLLILNIFINSAIINTIELVIVIIMLGRSLSKNIYARSNENQKYLKFKKKLSKPFSNLKRNINDKDHIYKKCHYCKTTLKLPLPSRRGFKKAKCPKCGKRVKVFTLKKEKIEIITNNKYKKI